jgi:hypothetical protein
MTAVDKLLDQRDQLRRATKMAAKDAEREVARDSKVLDDRVMVEETTSEAPTAPRQLDKSPTAISSEAVAETALAQDPPRDEQSLLPQGSQTKDRQSQEQAAAGW